MATVEYSFYTATYHGDTIPSANDFVSATVEAQAYIDSLTRGKVNSLASVPFGYKMAVCAVADIVYNTKQNATNGVVSSETVGSHSVSYVNTYKSDEAVEKEKARKATLFLTGTGLLCNVLR